MTFQNSHVDITLVVYLSGEGCLILRQSHFLLLLPPLLPPLPCRLLYCDHLPRAYVQILQWHLALPNARPSFTVTKRGTTSGGFQFTSGNFYSDILSGIFPDILSAMFSDISSDILSGIFLTFFLTHFWHSFWDSFWHTFWHTFWHSVWHPFWRSFWHISWHSV